MVDPTQIASLKKVLSSLDTVTIAEHDTYLARSLQEVSRALKPYPYSEAEEVFIDSDGNILESIPKSPQKGIVVNDLPVRLPILSLETRASLDDYNPWMTSKDEPYRLREITGLEFSSDYLVMKDYSSMGINLTYLCRGLLRSYYPIHPTKTAQNDLVKALKILRKRADLSASAGDITMAIFSRLDMINISAIIHNLDQISYYPGLVSTPECISPALELVPEYKLMSCVTVDTEDEAIIDCEGRSFHGTGANPEYAVGNAKRSLINWFFSNLCYKYHTITKLS